MGEVRSLAFRRALHRHDNPGIVTDLEIAEDVLAIHRECGMECSTKVAAVRMLRDN